MVVVCGQPLLDACDIGIRQSFTGINCRACLVGDLFQMRVDDVHATRDHHLHVLHTGIAAGKAHRVRIFGQIVDRIEVTLDPVGGFLQVAHLRLRTGNAIFQPVSKRIVFQRQFTDEPLDHAPLLSATFRTKVNRNLVGFFCAE